MELQGFMADKGEALLLAVSSRVLQPAIVVLMESHWFIAKDALGGFAVLESTYNAGFGALHILVVAIATGLVGWHLRWTYGMLQ